MTTAGWPFVEAAHLADIVLRANEAQALSTAPEPHSPINRSDYKAFGSP
jgi:hypothetical protein